MATFPFTTGNDAKKSSNLVGSINSATTKLSHISLILIIGIIAYNLTPIKLSSKKITGRKLHEGMGKLNFFPSFLAMNGIFMPMFIQGLAGLSRRMYDGGQQYAHASDITHWNEFMTISAFILGLAQIPFILNIFIK